MTRPGVPANNHALGAPSRVQLSHAAPVDKLTPWSSPAQVASKALEKNLTKLGPLVLPISEQLQFGVNLLQRKVLGKRIAPYVPNFAKAFNHFCLHAGAPISSHALFKELPLPVSPEAGPMSGLLPAAGHGHRNGRVLSSLPSIVLLSGVL